MLPILCIEHIFKYISIERDIITAGSLCWRFRHVYKEIELAIQDKVCVSHIVNNRWTHDLVRNQMYITIKCFMYPSLGFYFLAHEIFLAACGCGDEFIADKMLKHYRAYLSLEIGRNVAKNNPNIIAIIDQH